jgi:hypothetical protein
MFETAHPEHGASCSAKEPMFEPGVAKMVTTNVTPGEALLNDEKNFYGLKPGGGVPQFSRSHQSIEQARNAALSMA